MRRTKEIGVRARCWLLLTLPLIAGAVAMGCGDDDDADGGDAPEGRPAVVYMALDDSLVAGAGASTPEASAYVPLVRARLDGSFDGRRPVTLLNLGRGGETTTSMIEGGQLEEALAELAVRNGNAAPDDDVRVITLHIGGNDSARLYEACAAGLTPQCQAAIPLTLASFASNYNSVLSELRGAAGPDALIVAGTYYNALAHPECRLREFAQIGDAVLEGAPGLLPSGVNDVIRDAALTHGALVAEVGALDASQLTGDCLHPTDSGHEQIAEAFIAAIEGA